MNKLAIVVAAGLCLCGCTSPTAVGPNNDPYESANRRIFNFNLSIDSHALRPSAERYVTYVPEGVRNAVHNALENLDSPSIFANDLLQGEVHKAGQTAGRFLLNSTFGAGGLFDVGTNVGIPANREDFGQTLAVWGVGSGAYLMMPLLGPVYPRDVAGQVVDYAMDPVWYLPVHGRVFWFAGHRYLAIVDGRARNLEALDEIERDSLDFYATTRSLYRQYRENAIRNGMPPP
jgi:phospholipid-binding lipoprotein MlaA